MKTNIKKSKTLVKKELTTDELVNDIFISKDILAEVKYCKRGCFIPINNGYNSDLETCRESARYRYYDYRRSPTFFMGFYHPVKKSMTLSQFLSQFNDLFNVKNRFIDLPNGITVLCCKDNFWMENDLNFEVLTLLARSFDVINDPKITSLGEWAKRVKGKDLLSEDVVQFIVHFKKLSKLDWGEIDLDDFGGLVDFIETTEEHNEYNNFRSLLFNGLGLSNKDLVNMYVK